MQLAEWLQRPVVATTAFGALNVFNYRNLSSGGCTPPVLDLLLVFAIPFAAGVVCLQVGWFTALIMSLPSLWIMASEYPFASWLYEYAACYLIELAFVSAGQLVRRRLINPLISRATELTATLPHRSN